MPVSQTEWHGVGRSPDGQIRAVVGPDGAPTELSIGPEAMRLPASDLASQILAAIQIAHNDVVGQVNERVSTLDPTARPTGPSANNTETMARIKADVERAANAATEQPHDAFRRLTAILGDLPPRR